MNCIQPIGANCSFIIESVNDTLKDLINLVVDVVQFIFNWMSEVFSSFTNSLKFCLEEICTEGVPDINELRRALNAHIDPYISPRLTTADFTTLCQEFPIRVTIRNAGREILRETQVQKIDEVQALLNEAKAQVNQAQGEEAARGVQCEVQFPEERKRIGIWATRWAESRDLHIDPEHPYFEIFQAAFQHKNQIEGGANEDPDYRNYSNNVEAYLFVPLFKYIIYSLMGFQELSRPENRELMRYLDNHKSTFDTNPAYQFARSLSKIYCYPTANYWDYQWGDRPMDIPDKLQIGIGAPMAAFHAAQQHGKVLEYFQQGFNNRNCFDYRVSELQEFQFNTLNPHIEDFTPLIQQKATTKEKILEYYRAFKNKQIFRMTQQVAGLIYEELKASITRGDDNPTNHLFYQNFCTKELFQAFLNEEGEPIREKRVDPLDMAQPPQIPLQPDWNNAVPQGGFKRIPLAQIPEDRRHIGAILGVKDPNYYIATVSIINRPLGGEQCYLVFSRQQLAHWQVHPAFAFHQLWNGHDRALINRHELPWERRFHGALVKILDPAVYQVKVHAIEGNQAVVDFRGDPIPRAKWENDVLQDTEGTSYWQV